MKHSVVMLSVGLIVMSLSGGAWAAGADDLDPAKIAAAKTPADHEAVAKAYEAEADSLDKRAASHKDLAQMYTSNPSKPWQASEAKHCDSVASSLKAAAAEDRALAAEHHKLAKEAQK
jgi:hypothetical protein